MIFNENEIRKDTASDSRNEYVSLATVTGRIKNAVESELAFTHDYLDGDLLTREDAEELLLGIHRLVKSIKRKPTDRMEETKCSE